jgi:cholesterol transport system auxiliary component
MNETGGGKGLSRRALIIGAGGLGLAGCGGPPPVTFDLTAPREGLRRGGGRTLIVAEPTTVFALEADRIVIRNARGEITYLPRAQWTDRLPRLVQARLIQTFENAGRAGVGRPSDRISGAVQLTSDIRSFEIREASRDALVEIAVKLVGSATGAVGRARLFVGRAPVSAIDGPGATTALDLALASVLTEIVAWAR